MRLPNKTDIIKKTAFEKRDYMERVCSADDRIIAALDVDSFEKMESIVEELGELVSFYKVGMELYYAEGSKTMEWLHEKGKQVFLDLKMYDIPNTVAHGISAVSGLGIDLITIHAGGGRDMMEAAVQAADEAGRNNGRRPKILAVTVLTSFDETVWKETGGLLPIESQVFRLAKLAKSAASTVWWHRRKKRKGYGNFAEMILKLSRRESVRPLRMLMIRNVSPRPLWRLITVRRGL